MALWNPKVNDLFLRAAEIEAPGDRRLFLDQQCGDDADLRAQVESLLAVNDKAAFAALVAQAKASLSA